MNGERRRRIGEGVASAWLGRAAVGLTLALTLAGCGGGSGDEDPASPAGGAAPVTPGGGTPASSAAGPEGPTTLDAADVERLNRAAGLMGRYDYEGALSLIDELVAAYPAWTRVRVDRAIAVMNRQDDGDEQLARDLLASTLADDPRDLRALYVAGLLDLRAGEVEQAAERLGAVAEADPGDPIAAYFHGQAIESSDPEAALAAYERAASRDPYLRSAFYRAASVLRRLGRGDEATEQLERFLALADDPRARTAEFVYTRMGRKAEVGGLASSAPTRPAAPRPGGPVFAAPLAVAADAGVAWSGRAAPIAVDLDGDGDVDVFALNAIDDPASPNAVLLAEPGGLWRLDRSHALAAARGAFALAADLDDDGDVDVHVGDPGAEGSRTWFADAAAPGGWRAGPVHPGQGLMDGLAYDVDHDGDLDIIRAPRASGLQLLRQSDGGTLEAVPESPLSVPVEAMLPGGGLAALDVDGDRDLDLIVMRQGGGPVLFRNGRLGTWTVETVPAPTEDPSWTVSRFVPADVDADGRPELYAAASGGSVVRWTDAEGWGPGTGADAGTGTGADADAATAGERPGQGRFALADVDGVPGPELVSLGEDGAPIVSAPPTDAPVALPLASTPWTLVLEDVRRGPSLMTFSPDGPRLFRPGPGRHDFVALDLRGRVDVADSLRSNAAGIGTEWAVRTGEAWAVGRRLRSTSGPGQSLQPVSVGLGGAARADYIALEWSDGVAQSEVHGAADAGAAPVDLSAGRVVSIVETQRQLSSCPVIFAWDGTTHRFVSDVLGVGGLGYLVAPGVYAPPRPRERFLMPAGLPVPRDGQLELRLHEPMEEICLLDHAAFDAWDLPPGWDLVPDERLDLAPPAATGTTRFFRLADEHRPVAATGAGGEDVLDTILEIDGRAAPGPAPHRRFIGTRTGEQILTLSFAADLDAVPAGAVPTLIADGWVEYPYSQTNFAAAQAGVVGAPPTLEARGADGVWRTVAPEFGYPAGMPRRMSLPLADLPAGCRDLRIRTGLEVYWDRLSVVATVDAAAVEPAPVHRRLLAEAADLRRSGFPRRITGPQRRPAYDYADRRPFADMRAPRGALTRTGDVGALVDAIDDATAIFGPGEEIRLVFSDPGPPPAGWTRRLVLDVAGWCKDMDLFTRNGDTVEPLPGRDGVGPGPAARALDARFRTRHRDGR